MSTEIASKIQTFLSKRFENYDFGEEEDIFATGLVNSLFAMQLVLFLEKEFGVEIGDDDLSMDNFRTIAAMTALVNEKNAA